VPALQKAGLPDSSVQFASIDEFIEALDAAKQRARQHPKRRSANRG
jgi:hypothetical protein